MYEFFLAPFAEFDFMKRALIGSFALALGAGPVGAFLMLRRLSLTGDAMAHAILPGAGVGYLVAGLSLPAMTIGGLVAGVTVAVLSGLVARFTALKDASLAAFYLLSLALGVMLVSLRGSNVDLLHVLFGTVLALDNSTLYLIAGIASVTLVTLALIYRPLVLECLDPVFLHSVSSSGAPVHFIFLALVVMNLVGGFHALGTLLAVGLMMLPAAAARLWTQDVTRLLGLSVLTGMASGYIGLLASYHSEVPAGPSIILAAGFFYLFSLAFGSEGGFARRLVPARDLEA